jgi:acyl-CoA synthetase (AMP-forming)/AMP-acid ligase II
LVEFHIKNNPQHEFCVQAEKRELAKEIGEYGTYGFVSVTYEKLQHAILRCQSWLADHTSGIHSPVVGDDSSARRCAPFAILMESHVGLAVYVLTLMGMGVPAVLLSARLSPLAVGHLVRETGARTVLVSQRLRPILSESILSSDLEGVRICVAAAYEEFLGEGPMSTNGRILHLNHYISEEDQHALILHSSGTSGLPKPIYCSHRHFLGFATCHNFSSDIEARGLTISTSPFFHVSAPVYPN